MNAIDVMSSPVVTVTPFTTVRDIVAILVDKRISGLLVVEDGELLGMVGEGDLVHRHEIGTDEWLAYRSWWQRLTGSDPGPAAYVKSHGARARDIMNHEVTRVSEDTPVGQIASIFEDRSIRRLPVLRGDQLVGIVTRTDLIRALAVRTKDIDPTPQQPSDESILERLLTELRKQPWWQPEWCGVYVTNGIVRYRGVYDGEWQRRAARVAAENVPGVRAVEDDRVSSVDWQPMV